VRNFPSQAEHLLREVARTSNKDRWIYQAIETLRETNSFTLAEELDAARRCNSETLFELYRHLAHDDLDDTNTWNHRLPSEVSFLDDNVELVEARIDDLEFAGGDVVGLKASLCLTAIGHSGDPDLPSEGRRDFNYTIEAHWEHDGIEIDSIR